MIRLFLPVLAIIMFFNLTSSAQKKYDVFIQWKQAGELPRVNDHPRSPGFAGAVAGIHHDKLLLAGGANFPDTMPWLGGKKKYYQGGFVFQKKGSRLVAIQQTFNLPENIAYSASCSTREGVLYAGGENENGISNKTRLLQWDEHTSSPVIKELSALPLAVTNASITENKQFIYIAGGETVAGVTDQFIRLDLDRKDAGWIILPNVPRPVSHAVLTFIERNGESFIYLTGGRRRKADGISDLYNSVFEFNILKNKWTEKTPLPHALSAGTGVAAGTGQVLLFGGDKGSVFHQVETLVAAISREKDESKKQILNREKIQLQSSHPGFSKELLLYDTRTGECKTIGSIPFDTPVTTTVVKWGKWVLLPSGEIRAGVRTPYILSGKIPAKLR